MFYDYDYPQLNAFTSVSLHCGWVITTNKHYCIEGLRAIVLRRLLDCTELFWLLMLLRNFQILLRYSKETFCY